MEERNKENKTERSMETGAWKQEHGNRIMETELNMQIRLSVPWNFLLKWKSKITSCVLSGLIYVSSSPRDIQRMRNLQIVATLN